MEPNENYEHIDLRVDKNTKKRIQKAAKESGGNMSVWIRQLILRELNHPR